MQTQDAPAEFLFKLWPKLEANKMPIIVGLVAVIVASGGWYVITSQRAQNEIVAGEALSAFLMSPTANSGSAQAASGLEVIAAKYAGTAAGERAQVQAAGALYEAGNYPEAQAQFEKYLNANPAGPLAATAQLGVAASLEAQNKTDQAFAAYQRVVSGFQNSPCIGQAEYALGRICEQQNKLTDAMNHYENATRESLSGSLRNEAMLHASELQARIAATAPKPATTLKPAVTPTPAPASQPATKP